MTGQSATHEDNILKHTWWTAAIGSPVFWLFAPAIGWGFALGSVLGALAFRLLILNVHGLTQQAAGSPWVKGLLGYFQRYLLYAAVMATALSSDMFSFPAAVIGLLIPKFWILFHGLIRRTPRGD